MLVHILMDPHPSSLAVSEQPWGLSPSLWLVGVGPGLMVCPFPFLSFFFDPPFPFLSFPFFGAFFTSVVCYFFPTYIRTRYFFVHLLWFPDLTFYGIVAWEPLLEVE